MQPDEIQTKLEQRRRELEANQGIMLRMQGQVQTQIELCHKLEGAIQQLEEMANWPSQQEEQAPPVMDSVISLIGGLVKDQHSES